jgi:hypothetical protein
LVVVGYTPAAVRRASTVNVGGRVRWHRHERIGWLGQVGRAVSPYPDSRPGVSAGVPIVNRRADPYCRDASSRTCNRSAPHVESDLALTEYAVPTTICVGSVPSPVALH